MEKYVCEVCGWVYDPALGDPENGIDQELLLPTFPTIGYVRCAEWEKTSSTPKINHIINPVAPGRIFLLLVIVKFILKITYGDCSVTVL